MFDNQYTLEGNQYLRDYNYTMLYNKDNISLFQHEHIIYVSDYFIKKLNKSSHFYIDGTFVYPKGFKQLIVILYYDSDLNKRFPGLFALINNKKENGYLELFRKIYDIISINKTKEISLKSYTIDFEIGLINVCKSIFKNVKCVGCYYHYTRAIWEYAKNIKLIKKDNKQIVEKFLKILYKPPFLYDKDKNFINAQIIKYEENYNFLSDYIEYYKKQWFKYFLNGMLDYTNLDKFQRSNSYIENYNRRIKLKLSKYLYGKSKCKISWPLFLYFIKNEEKDVKNDNYNLENKVEIKLTDIKYENKEKFKSKKLIEANNILFEDNTSNKIEDILIYNRPWLKFNQFSCGHDVFFYYIILLFMMK